MGARRADDRAPDAPTPRAPDVEGLRRAATGPIAAAAGAPSALRRR
jgi:hypothetical protein